MTKSLLVFFMCAAAAVTSMAIQDNSYLVCTVKSSSMKMYHRGPINVRIGPKSIHMDQRERTLDATINSTNGNGYKIVTQNLFSHDEWNSGAVYISKKVSNYESGEVTIVDQFTDGTEHTVLSCSAGDEG